jgi:hypothetical protein
MVRTGSVSGQPRVRIVPAKAAIARDSLLNPMVGTSFSKLTSIPITNDRHENMNPTTYPRRIIHHISYRPLLVWRNNIVTDP